MKGIKYNKMGGNYGKCLIKFRIYFKEFHSDTEVEGTEFITDTQNSISPVFKS